MPADGQLQKAVLRVHPDSEAETRELAFTYNPAELTTQKSANWNRPPQQGARSASRPQFTGAGPQTVTMELWFDAWDNTDVDVTAKVKTLFEWTKPTPQSIQQHLPRPPVLEFEWGSSDILTDLPVFLKTVNAKYVLFKPDGTPIRASATVTLEEVVPDPPSQNPTSGSRESRRTHLLDAGDSLAATAFREYGDPALWRGLAAFNGIDDPLRVEPGTRILVPSAAEARRLAAGEG